MIDPILARLSAIVGRYEGYVEKFAGDALLALFGAPVAHEDDAVRALHAGLEMQREIARGRDELPAGAGGLTLHIGVNSGHGIARVMGGGTRLDYGVLGDSVIVAQRLQAAAPAGAIYVGETTRTLARERFDFEPVGDLALKGLERTVPAWRLVSERTGRAGEPFLDRHAVVGRDRELMALDASLDRLLDGSGGVVVIEGEPGVGKSTLVGVLHERASSRGARWLETRSLSYGSAIAYRPIAELLRSFAGLRLADPPETVGPALEGSLGSVGLVDLLPYLARLLGATTTSTPGTASMAAVADMEPEAFQRGLHGALGRWLATLAAESPLVVLVEDVHWADSSSLALLEELIAMDRAGPCLFVLTRRPELDPRIEALRAAGDGRSVTVSLSPLDRVSIEALVASRLGGAVPPPGLGDVLHDRTGGNPFFVDEVVRVLLETGVLRPSDGGWLVDDGWDASGVPVTIEGVLAARIDLLPARVWKSSRPRRSSDGAFAMGFCAASSRASPTWMDRSASSSTPASSTASTMRARRCSPSTMRSSRMSPTGGCSGVSDAISIGAWPMSPGASTARVTTTSTCWPATSTLGRPARRRSTTSSVLAIAPGASSRMRRRSSTSGGRPRLRPHWRRRIRRWPRASPPSASTSPTCRS